MPDQLTAPVDLIDGARARVLVEAGQLHVVLDGAPGIRVASWPLEELGLAEAERSPEVIITLDEQQMRDLVQAIEDL